MLGNLGFLLMFLCAIASTYGVVASFTAAFTRHRQLYYSSRLAATMVSVMCMVGIILIIYLFYQRDFSLVYIAKNSSLDLPALYTFTALWSSLEGSHFLWTFFISIFVTVAVWTNAKDNEHIMPYVLGTLQAVQAWMFYLLITHSDPFKMSLPAPPNGNGMNELLQNGYMASHPPMLFIGYTATAIPFAYAIAALFYGDITEGWLKSVRRWTLFGWAFLTAAITLGGRWAYVELGWAGYWAWDPVENSSFLPWLITTALFHSLIVQEKLGHLKRLTLILAIVAFFMTFFGTFITRSGVISSVHAFGEGPIGPNYLQFLAVLAVSSCLLYAIRAPSILPSENEKVWGFSKESALVVTQFLLLAFAAIVFIGTIFPIISEALTDQRTSVQAPYFNIFAPYVGLAMAIMIGIGNLMRYQSAKMPGAKNVILVSLGLSIPLTIVFCYVGEVFPYSRGSALWAQIIGFYFTAFSFFCLFGDLRLKLKDLKFNYKLFFTRNLAYFGAFVAHIGFLICLVGFLGNYRGVEKNITLSAGESTQLFGYDFEFQKGIDVQKVQNVTLFVAPLTVKKQGRTIYKVYPAQSKYPTKPGQNFNEIAVEGGFWHDIYVVLTDFDRKTGKSATLSININPTVKFVWLAVAIMVLGGLISLFDKYRGNRSRDVVAGKWQLGDV